LDVCIIFAQGRALFLPEICYWSVMSVSHDVGLSCIQLRASHRQERLPASLAWSSYHTAACRDCRAKAETYSTLLQWASVLQCAGTSHSSTKNQNNVCSLW